MKTYRVYKLKNINKETIYVGYTAKTALERFAEHAQDKYWIDEVTEIEECVTTSECQARINEIYWINKIKPIFNAKDKFSGTVDMKLSEKDSKFSHVSYSFNGVPTNAINSINDEYTLIDTLDMLGLKCSIGIYYDSYLNLWISATDICKAVGLKRKRPQNFAKSKDIFRKSSFSYNKGGKEKNDTFYLCNEIGAIKILENFKNEEMKRLLLTAIQEIYKIADLKYKETYEGESLAYKEIIKMAFEENLSDKLLENSNLKRRLAFKIILNDCDNIDEILDEYLVSHQESDVKIEAQEVATEIFALVDTLVNEYQISYKDVFSEYNDYLLKEYGLYFWKMRSHMNKVYDLRMQPHFIVALNKEELYIPFINFYEKKLEENPLSNKNFNIAGHISRPA